MSKVFVDIEAESPFLKSLQRAFPAFEVEAQQVTPNDHANARAFSHLATKLIEQETEKDTLILDIGSAPARRMMSEHTYHCVCPMRSAEDPERLLYYARKLAKASGEVVDRNIAAKIDDLQSVMATPDNESRTFCLHTDQTCRTPAEVAVYQDVYAVHAPTSLYFQAMKGVRTAYWIGFDTTPFMFDTMAGAYPTYATNWADEQVLKARNIGLCSAALTEGHLGKLSIMRKKRMKPSDQIMFSVGSTLYTESRRLLKSWHLPSVFHLKGRQSYTCRCDTIVSCEGYVVKKITMSPGVFGKTSGYAVTHHAEGFLVCKTTDTIAGERVSFPVCTYVPSTICDQMTGILATEVTPEGAQKLLVGLNQRIVVNGRTQRNTNTMKNYLLPVVSQAFSKWAKEYRLDQDDEKNMGMRERTLTCCCLWAFKTHKNHTMYKKPDTQTIVRVPSEFNSFVIPSLWSAGLSIGIRHRIRLLLQSRRADPLVPSMDASEARAAEKEAAEAKEAEETLAALPPLIPTAPLLDDIPEVDVEELEFRAGAGVVETPRNALKVTPQDRDTMVGSYLVLSPQTVLKSVKLQVLHSLAEQVKIITHKGRAGRYQVDAYDGRVLIPTGAAIPVPDFQALSESATMVYNEREFINRKLYHIAVHGAALNTDEEGYEKVRAERTDAEYVFDVDRKQCVKREDAEGLVMIGELVYTPFHEFAYEGLKRRPAAPYTTTVVGVFGVPGSGKSGIIKSLVTRADLVTSGKRENCQEIMHDVKRYRDLDITAKTVDSVLLNGVKQTVDVLYVDEAFACHAGTLLALIATVRPRKKVVLCGDPKQCGFFNLMQLQVNFNHNICTEVHHKSISRRCTLPITAIVSTLHYEGKMRTTNPYNKPVIIDTTGQTKPNREDIVLTCFRGWVKQLQLDYRGHEVMTAAASQGLTRKGVYAVRMKVNENPLYAQSSEHVNVLLTRTEGRLVWKTLSGDPWIKTLSNIPKGDFTATLEDWQQEHDAIMRAITQEAAPLDVFQNKAKVCWAKCLVPVLETAGIKLSAADWSAIILAFKEDRAYSPEVALNEICTKIYGVDLDSGLFSAPRVSLHYTTNHWDNSPGGRMYGFSVEAANRLEQRHPFYRGRWASGQVLVAERKTQPIDITCNLIPFNRRLPHALVTEYHPVKGERVEWLVNKIPGYHLLLVSEYNLILPRRKVTWIAPPTVTGADLTHDLDLGLPPNAGRYDLVFVNMHTPYRLHHYQQCVDHAMKLQMLGGDALYLLKPGGSLLLRAYGYADRTSEAVVTALARRFSSFRAVRPPCVTSNTEVFLLFTNFDNGRRTVTLHPTNGKLSSIYAGTVLQAAGCAPAYTVKRADIATAIEDAVVNAANHRGQVGDGVCRAVARKWPQAFRNAATPVGTAKTVKCDETYIIHAVGPNFNNTSEAEGDRDLAAAYRAVAAEINRLSISSVAIPLLSTGIFSAGKDRVHQSLSHLLAAMDTTEARVTIYCRDKTWEQKIKTVLQNRCATELVSDELQLEVNLTRVHPDSSLVGRPGYSTTDGTLYSYMEGTKFHQAALDMAEITTLWPRVQDANEHICMYALGETMDNIRSRCPVEDSDSSTPPKTVPCLCRYAMTPERVTRLRMHHTKDFVVCSSFQLPKYRIAGVQRVKCEKVMLFDATPPASVSPVQYLTSHSETTVSLSSFSITSDSSSLSTFPDLESLEELGNDPQSMRMDESDNQQPISTAEPVVQPVPPPRPKRARRLAAARMQVQVEVHRPPVVQRTKPVPAPRTSLRPVPAPRRCMPRPAVELPWPQEAVDIEFGAPTEEESEITFGDFSASEWETISNSS
uniref:Polyprotein P1234 n=1 Tax=Mayaro virus TaxID=59301 RepID=A0A0P0CE59_9VIRU|nr:Nsp1-3 [Mayaro virus]